MTKRTFELRRVSCASMSNLSPETRTSARVFAANKKSSLSFLTSSWRGHALKYAVHLVFPFCIKNRPAIGERAAADDKNEFRSARKPVIDDSGEIIFRRKGHFSARRTFAHSAHHNFQLADSLMSKNPAKERTLLRSDCSF